MMFRKKMGGKSKDHGLGQHNECVPPSPALVPMPRWSKTVQVEKPQAWQQSKVQLPKHVQDLLLPQAHALKALSTIRPGLLFSEPEPSLNNDEKTCSWSVTKAPSVDLLADWQWIVRSHGSPRPCSILDGQHGVFSEPGSVISAFREFKETQASLASQIDDEAASKLPMSIHPYSKMADRADCSPSNQSTPCPTKDNHADPKLQHAQSLALAGHGLSGYTTVMMQRVPFKYSQKKLVHEIHGAGFEGTYDFLYLPSNARSHGSRGFGFINFLSSGLAEEFYRRYHGQKFNQLDEFPLIVIPADVQGFDESAQRYLSSWQLRLTKQSRKTMPVFYKPVNNLVTQDWVWQSGKHSSL